MSINKISNEICQIPSIIVNLHFYLIKSNETDPVLVIYDMPFSPFQFYFQSYLYHKNRVKLVNHIKPARKKTRKIVSQTHSVNEPRN